MGHEVYFASDGEEAFKSYLKNSIEIVITDLKMPHVDGLEFIGTVRALFPKAVIIAVSGQGQDQLDAALSAGARVALSKPIDTLELRKAIAESAPESLGPGKKDVRVMTPSDEPFLLIVEDDPRPSCPNPGGVQKEFGPKQDSFGLLWLGGSGVP